MFVVFVVVVVGGGGDFFDILAPFSHGSQISATISMLIASFLPDVACTMMVAEHGYISAIAIMMSNKLSHLIRPIEPYV